jgi:hypothetical protein
LMAQAPRQWHYQSMPNHLCKGFCSERTEDALIASK